MGLLNNPVNICKASELYTLSERIVYYMDYNPNKKVLKCPKEIPTFFRKGNLMGEIRSF